MDCWVSKVTIYNAEPKYEYGKPKLAFIKIETWFSAFEYLKKHVKVGLGVQPKLQPKLAIFEIETSGFNHWNVWNSKFRLGLKFNLNHNLTLQSLT